jgi:hypothetical protein
LVQFTDERNNISKAKSMLIKKNNKIIKFGITEDLTSLPPLITVRFRSRNLDERAKNIEKKIYRLGDVNEKKRFNKRAAQFSAQGD